VIKIERPATGDFARGYDERVRGLASHFVWTNRSKESLTLDMKHPDAARILQRLVLEKADVLVQNLAPGAAARLGMGYEALSAVKPSLIVCDISGYGDDPHSPGPYRDKKAYDLLIQSEAGFVSVTGTEEEPCKAGASMADIAAGMYAYSSVLAALLQRGQSGARSAHRHLDARGARRVDQLSALLRDRRRAAPAAHRCQPRDDLSVRPVSGRRWVERDAGSAERTRVGRVLQRGPAPARSRHRRALCRQTRNALPRARSSSRSSSTCSRR
jgi:hypothetical protein